MNARPLLVCIALLSGMSGCRSTNTETLFLNYPDIEFSQKWVEFEELSSGETSTRSFTMTNRGDLAMGVAAIYEGSGQEEDFEITWSESDIVCPEGSETEDTGTTASAKGVDTADTGPTFDTGDDTGTTGTTSADQDVALVLGAGCTLPVSVTFSPIHQGDIYGSVIIETATQALPDDSTDDPAYWADLQNARNIIYVSGSGLKGEGRTVVRPRFVDYGHLWTGLEKVRYVEVHNAGDGELVLNTPELADGCEEDGFAITWTYDDGTILAGGNTSLVEVTFTPTDTSGSICTLNILSDDASDPIQAVTLQGNTGSDPENEPPTVHVRTPEPGYQHLNGGLLNLELNVFDVNQPADTLSCKIKSVFLVQAKVADCKPLDESGHVSVDIDTSDFEHGSDTLLVTVTDASQVTSYASVPVIVASGYPSSDDDGDGFGDADTGPQWDCNDQQLGVYPEAAEVWDGLDNDCDNLIDEGTDGADDDGDTFTEQDGDCDDNDASSMPNGPEAADHKDNDCDGVVDEHTSLYDDDNDGYAEVNNDCDDRDDTVHPGAIEYCDGLDNDCNGRKDQQDDCVDQDTVPVIVGGIDLAQTACEENDTIQLSVFVHDADGQDVTYAWSLDSAGGQVDDLTAPSVAWTAPELDGRSNGDIFSVWVIAQDEDGNQVWDFNEISVYPEGDLYDQQFVEIIITDDESGCSAAPAAPVAWLAVFALGLMSLRRRD